MHRRTQPRAKRELLRQQLKLQDQQCVCSVTEMNAQHGPCGFTVIPCPANIKVMCSAVKCKCMLVTYTENVRPLYSVLPLPTCTDYFIYFSICAMFVLI